jgi:hypothetical protein
MPCHLAPDKMRLSAPPFKVKKKKKGKRKEKKFSFVFLP